MIGHCTTCGLKQTISQCKKVGVARVMIKKNKEKARKTVTMFCGIINFLVS